MRHLEEWSALSDGVSISCGADEVIFREVSLWSERLARYPIQLACLYARSDEPKVPKKHLGD